MMFRPDAPTPIPGADRSLSHRFPMTPRFLVRLLSVGAALTIPSAASAQSAPAGFDLTIPDIMRGPEVVGRPPAQVRWSPDGQYLYFQWLPPCTAWRETPKARAPIPSALW